MAEDKRKARKAILGELESIKHLLEEGEDGSASDLFVEPPLLTNTADWEDEAPLLTEALNQVIKDIAPSFDEPAEPLAAQSGPGPSSLFDESSFEEISLDINEDDIPTLEASIDGSPHNYGGEDDDEDDYYSGGDYEDDEFEDEDDEDFDDLDDEEDEDDEDFDDVDDDDDEYDEDDDEDLDDEDEDYIDEIEEEDALKEAALLEQGEAAPLRREPEQPDLVARAVKNREAVAATAAPRPAEKQRSLFEADTTSPPTATAPPSKTENPFLPKHIRDRLHANRTLQQEISANFARSQSASPSASQPASQSVSQPASQVGNGPSSSSQFRSSEQAAAIKPTPNQKPQSATDKLVDELVESYLPRIEADLRSKLRALIERQIQLKAKP